MAVHVQWVSTMMVSLVNWSVLCVILLNCMPTHPLIPAVQKCPERLRRLLRRAAYPRRPLRSLRRLLPENGEEGVQDIRAQQRLRAGGKNKSRRVLRQFVCNDELTSDRVQWSEEVHAKCKDKYEDNNFEDEDMASLAYLLRGYSSSSSDPEVLLEDAVKARGGLNSGKVSGGGSPVVNEWIKSMPVTLLFWFVEVVNTRMLGQKIEVMQSWLLLILIILRTVPQAC